MDSKHFGSMVILLLLLGAMAASAQTDPVRDPSQGPGAQTAEKLDASEPAPIDWDQASRSALGDTFFVKKNPLRTSVEVVGVNTLIWFYDRYIREGGTNPGFRISFNSWAENLANGFEWDDNSFTTNQFAHPYHGSLYFNAARSNGYSFWESIPWTFGGSFLWEYFFEVHHPSMNDWIATSMGGVTMGEMLHRLSLTVWDNTATGSGRNWREVGGFVINPMGGLNRLIDGDWGRVYANSPDRLPLNFRSQMDLGIRTVADDRLWSTDTTRVYAKFEWEYGDMFFGDMGKPFDYFDFRSSPALRRCLPSRARRRQRDAGWDLPERNRDRLAHPRRFHPLRLHQPVQSGVRRPEPGRGLHFPLRDRLGNGNEDRGPHERDCARSQQVRLPQHLGPLL